MNLTTLTDDELSDHLNAALAERERRASLASIPAQVTEMAERYAAGGGDLATLRTAIG